MAVQFMKVQPAKAQPNSLRYHLHKSMSRLEHARPLERIHASDLTKDVQFCPRERMIGRISGVNAKPERIGAATVATYDFGHAIQELVTTWFADAGMAIGDWQCLACKSIHNMQPRPHGHCGHCQFDAGYRYVERRFVSQSTGASCGIDLLVNTVGPKLRVVEIKSMLKDDFKKLAGPLAEHKLRTNLYMRLIEDSADEDRHRIDTQEAYVLYICKGGYVSEPEVGGWAFGDWGYTPFKDFKITRDDKQTDYLLEGPRAYREAAEKQVIPTGLCTSIHDARAKKCSVATACFSGKFPAGAKFV